MKKIAIITFFGFLGVQAHAQIGINTNEPKAALDIRSMKSGVILPTLPKFIIEIKKENNQGELFFSEDDQCLMLNIAPKSATKPEWVCLSNEPGAIPLPTK
ncbi:hypothetical protein EDM00_08700 [Ornithobacterium rhinotracheale]|uniref:hypothetical protein n=1 Tax=Ornithobacterium rhinotracheale TaxID=28251 RepID=UPI00129C40A1|nr:hypothetical protein [Ornithobacterium rhinotracheale]MRI64065.1 hypothetical protein [Ornithobacterium rhinotracheale]MRJ09523.1 hypothetical protein [Ornithobacterium rhinotracheale]